MLESPSGKPGSRPKGLCFWTFIATASISVLLMTGVIRSADNLLTARIAEAIAHRGRLDIRPLEHFRDYATTKVRKSGEERYYPKWSFGWPLAVVPFHLLADALPPSIKEEIRHTLPIFHLTFYNPDSQEGVNVFFLLLAQSLVLGLIAWLACSTSCLLTNDPVRALLASFLSTVLSPLLIMAQDFWQEVPLSFLILAGYYLIKKEELARRSLYPFFAGLVMGYAVLVKVSGILAAGCFFLFLLVRHRKDLKAPLAYLGGLVPLIAVLLVANYLRFGSPFEFGYGSEQRAFTNPFWEGLFGLLLSPGRGILFFWPLVIATILAAIRGASDRIGLYLLVLYLLFYSKWHMWEGGWCFGPRFLYPLIPLLAVNASSLRGRHWSKILSVLGLLSLFVVLTGLKADYLDYHYVIYYKFGGKDELFHIRWDVLWSPLVGYWRLPMENHFLVLRAFTHGGWFLKTLFLGALAGLTAGLVMIRKEVRNWVGDVEG